MTVASFKPFLCTLLALLLAATTARAQGSRGPVHTEPPQDDAAYWLMGEFVGPLTVGENEYETIGLQIRPLGADQFEALAFSGGLPGQQKHQRDSARKMIGRQSDGFLVLSGGPWAIFAEKDHCLILSRTGERLGRLERIQRRSPTLGAQPPAEAQVLFDGTSTDQFIGGKMTDEGLLVEGADIKPMFQDFDLHLEFLLPYMPEATDQGRGNSGVYIQSRYECQILDSFGVEPAINGAGSLYKFKAPDLNMALPPLVWQTYDIRFTAPRWSADGEKIRNARITAWLNGVIVQDDVELEDKTGAGKPEEPVLLPTKLQNHSDPVRFRNIWVVDRGLAPLNPFPVEGSAEPEPAAAESKADQAKEAEEADQAEDAETAKQPAEPPEAEVETEKDSAKEPAPQSDNSADADQNAGAEQNADADDDASADEAAEQTEAGEQA